MNLNEVDLSDVLCKIGMDENIYSFSQKAYMNKICDAHTFTPVFNCRFFSRSCSYEKHIVRAYSIKWVCRQLGALVLEGSSNALYVACNYYRCRIIYI